MGQLDIHNDQIGHEAARLFEHLPAIADRLNHKTMSPQQIAE